MIKTYFKIAWRTLFQNKLYSTLNVVGLSFGLVCFFVLGLYVIDEMTYDGFHTHSDRIYRVIKNRKSPYEAINIAGGGFMLAEESKIRIGEIENTARMTQGGRDVLENVAEQKKVNEEITAANNGLMEIFDFEAIDGNPKTALVEPNSIVLVEELAVQLFGSTQVVGKTLKWQGLEQPFKVTAVIKNHPSNSSFHFSSVYSESTYFPDSSAINEARSDWGSHEYAVYALLRKDATPSVVSAKLSQLVNTNLKQVEGLTLNYSLQPIKDMHLYSEGIIDRPRSLSPKGEGLNLLLYAKMFALVAFFVLLTACINYMNLTTARASNRSKEIGIKKVVGAVRGQLIGQFLVESLVLTLFSFVLAVLAVNLILPAFNDFMQKQLSLGFSTDFRIWLTAISVAILAGLVAGSYPALMLSAFSPILLLKKLKITRTSDFNLRKGLVVFQFAISVSLIIATIVLFLQVQFVNNKDLGFNKDLLVVVDINSGKIRKAATTIVSEFEKIPNVKNVSSTSRVPGEWKTIPAVKIREMGKPDENKTSFLLSVDENFTKTFEIPLLAGRNFRSTGDSCSIILNETAAKLLNIKTPSEQLIEIPAASFGISFNPLRDNQVFKARVIGIVKDFNFQTLREKIAPLVLAYTQNPITHIDYYTARIETKDASATIKSMENVLAKIDAEEPFEYHYLDQQLALFYTEDARRQTMLIWVALATIFIACLGLFGLATYAVEQRIKEIGVRKILGASIFNLTTLLSKDFLKLVFIANGIAFPIAYWAMNEWLMEFAYHIEIKWWVFAIAGTMALLIALLTVSFQTIKAAVANPVKSLRTE